LRRTSTSEPLSPSQLALSPLLGRLEDCDLQQVLNVCRGVRFSAGSTIVGHGDDSEDVYFILEGDVRVNVFSPAGRHITFEMLRQGEMFGELAAVDYRSARTYNSGPRRRDHAPSSSHGEAPLRQGL
jgi:CRP-like cAMP-binding protein